VAVGDLAIEENGEVTLLWDENVFTVPKVEFDEEGNPELVTFVLQGNGRFGEIGVPSFPDDSPEIPVENDVEGAEITEPHNPGEGCNCSAGTEGSRSLAAGMLIGLLAALRKRRR